MKKLFTLALVGSAIALGACSGTTNSADYSYETAAPYADERTVGAKDAPVVTKKGDRVFESKVRK